jgi:hypothetical protein
MCRGGLRSMGGGLMGRYRRCDLWEYGYVCVEVWICGYYGNLLPLKY